MQLQTTPILKNPVVYFCSLFVDVRSYIGAVYRNRCPNLESFLASVLPSDYNRFGPVITKTIDVILDMFEKYDVPSCKLGIQNFSNYMKAQIFGRISGFS